MITDKQIMIFLGKDGNLYFKDWENGCSFVFVVNKQDLCLSFFNF